MDNRHRVTGTQPFLMHCDKRLQNGNSTTYKIMNRLEKIAGLGDQKEDIVQDNLNAARCTTIQIYKKIKKKKNKKHKFKNDAKGEDNRGYTE